MVENWLNGGILTEWLNHLNVVVFKLIKFVVYVVLGRGLSIQAAALACAARLTNASRSLETPFGRLTCVM